ncbi:hypothetical protein LTR08_007438 [Meristemomyces frigidus]|nr:hypothetical protein LTR08_007438 [Meristemomyces frigidus]
MSKFFRSMSSSSSSSDQTANEGEDNPQQVERETARPHGTTPKAGPRPPNLLSVTNRNPDNGRHSQVLLHALLEERCMNDVLNENGASRSGRHPDDPALRAEAQARYQRLCAVLSPYDLIASGLEHESLSPTRQKYRDGLDMLSRNALTTHTPPIPAPLGRALTDIGMAQLAVGAPQPFQLAKPANATSSVFDALSPAHAMLEPSRYFRDFDEVGVLGKGGYGTVYHVKHKLDSNQYAVKIVPISAARIARIRSRGQQELDDLLLELRTIARLDHPHVVRYFSGWIEWTNVTSHAQGSVSYSQVDPSHQQWLDEPDAIAGAENSEPFLGRVVTQSDSDTAGVVFESSMPDGDIPAVYSYDDHLKPSYSSHDEIHSTDSNCIGLGRPAPGLTLALHLQMAVYPLTLADFLMPPTVAMTRDVPLVHCFRMQPSLKILLALLEGVEYLHGQGVLHRDLKPANIFLKKTASSLEVRIGDFGLVTALAHPEAGIGAQSAAVGTPMYRPTTATTSSMNADLDIFALGIIAFELLWRFSTRMERHESLQRLKQGHFPPNFCERIGDRSGEVQSLIREMLSQQHHHVTDLKKQVASFVT